MKVAITEKRDVAHHIAKALGVNGDKGDWYEGNGWYITWCQGHLLELRVPEAEGRWSLEKLPILPERFYLGPISKGKDKEGNLIEDPGIKHRLRVIKDLVGKSDSIVCCTDAAREGQLIFDNVYKYTGIRKPTERLWISDLTEKAIRKGFASLKPNSEYDNLAKAARARSEADWIVGINATRAFTLSTGAQSVLSLGRVQTPTLCMICQRFLENKNFKSEPYWVLCGTSTKDGVTFKWRGEEKYDNRDKCEEDRRRAMANGYLDVVNVDIQRKNEEPPLLHDIASLQKAANSKYGMTAKQTQDATQSLYDKKYVSYPRTNSRYISDEIFAEVPSLLSSLSWHPKYGPHATAMAAAGHLSRHSVDASKMTDHHGLIITGVRPENLSPMEDQVYELIMSRFIEAFGEVCVADVASVKLDGNGVVFTAKGRKVLSQGWRAVCNEMPAEDVALNEVDDMEMTMCPLPQMTEGEKIIIGTLDVIDMMTKPKPLLTDATLLSMMENAGRRCSDKAGANALKGIGIGTAATRDSVIEELIKRTYVFREKKKLIPTALGLSVYGKVKDKEIANVDMTAEWEMALEEIAEGINDGGGFNVNIRKYASQITEELRNMESAGDIGKQTEAPTVVCPKCHKEIRLGASGARCECGFSVWRVVAGKRLSDEQLKELAEKGKTGKISGFKNKEGKQFSACLAINEEWKTVFFFPENDPESAVKCPRCGNPVSFNSKGAWCRSCNLSVWNTVAGKKLSDSQVRTLLQKGRTGVLSGFMSKAGRPFEAALVLGQDGKVTFEFPDRNDKKKQ